MHSTAVERMPRKHDVVGSTPPRSASLFPSRKSSLNKNKLRGKKGISFLLHIQRPRVLIYALLEDSGLRMENYQTVNATLEPNKSY